MAVQAQHQSSNLIFLNHRNGKEEEQDFSLQSQAGEFLGQTNMLMFNNGEKKRKRMMDHRFGGHLTAREYRTGSIPTDSITKESVSLMLRNHLLHFSTFLVYRSCYSVRVLNLRPIREANNQQLQFPQVIDLSLLHNHHHHPPSNMVYTGLRLSSGEDQAEKIGSNLFQQNSHHHRNLVSTSPEDVVAAHINRQSQELEGFLHAQAEELRRTLAEKRKMHYKALIFAVEEPLVRKLREKEAEIERATRCHNELEARDAQLRAEAQAWRERARAQETAAASLQAQLQQAVNIRRGGGVSAQDSRAGEEELLCAAGISGLDDAESAYVDPERVWRPRCKSCREREATVVVLPCRHLSICPECDRTALACPLCLTLRNSSVEVILC